MSCYFCEGLGFKVSHKFDECTMHERIKRGNQSVLKEPLQDLDSVLKELDEPLKTLVTDDTR